mmetsp:Transcript_122169/g.390744  ORF Transcript_122169/g.390744 Transcript_122169/m.390744 type:complete len:261 (-) Transcript_122169:157-939(-)
MWGLLVLVCLAGVVRGFGLKARAPDREGAASVAIAISEPRSLERLGGAFTHANVWEPNVQAAGPPLEKERQAVAAAGGAPTGNSTQGGTVCQCICGDRVVWHRLIFAGDVEKEKEKECEKEVCPHVIIPGLRVYAECNYVEDGSVPRNIFGLDSAGLDRFDGGYVVRLPVRRQDRVARPGLLRRRAKGEGKVLLGGVVPLGQPDPGLALRGQLLFRPAIVRFTTATATGPLPGSEAATDGEVPSGGAQAVRCCLARRPRH